MIKYLFKLVTGRQRCQRLVSDEGLVFELLLPVIPEEVPEHDLVTIAPSAGGQQDVGGDAPHWRRSITITASEYCCNLLTHL